MSPVLLNPSRFGIPASYSAEVLADSPLAYWKLDEASGTSVADSSGNSRTATYTNSPTVGAASLLTDGSGKSMGLTSNTGQCASIASAAWMNVSALTVDCLASVTSAVDASSGDAIISRYSSGGFSWLIWRDTSGKWGCLLSESSGGTRAVVSTVTAVSGTKYHLALTYTGSVLTFYVNGVASGTPFTGMSGFFAAATPIEIGRYSLASSTTPTGNVDEAAVYGTALSAARIAAHAAAA